MAMLVWAKKLLFSLTIISAVSLAGVFTPAETLAQVELFKNLKSPNPQVRTQAAKQIGELAQEHGVGVGKGLHPGSSAYLRELLVDPDPDSRMGAAEAMGEIRILDARSVELLKKRHTFGVEPEHRVWEQVHAALKKYEVAFEKFDAERKAFVDLVYGNPKADLQLLYSGVFTKAQIQTQVEALHILRDTKRNDAGMDKIAPTAEIFHYLTRNYENGSGPGVHPGAIEVLREFLKSSDPDIRGNAANALGMIIYIDEESMALLDWRQQIAVVEQSPDGRAINQARREFLRENEPLKNEIAAFVSACKSPSSP